MTPDDEELNYPLLFTELGQLGYTGFVGCEYHPRSKTVDGLGWLTSCAPDEPATQFTCAPGSVDT